MAIIGLQPLLAAAEEAGRHAVLVVDGNTGRVLYQRSADELRFPASLTKLMTLLLLFEQIEQGRLALTTKIRFSANAAGAPPSRLEVEEGAEIEVIDAIKALITKSANDVAIAVAERLAGSEARFAELMTRKAREIGMKSTVFRNASGLPDPDQVTTARDMITLALRLQDQFPKYYPLFATRTFTWGGDTYRNHNTLLFSYQGLDGMKTGYTRASGFNLVASVRRGKKHVVAAYFGGTTAALRNSAVRRHLDAALAKASDVRTRRPGASPVVPAVAQSKAQPKVQPKAAPERAAPKATPIAVAAASPPGRTAAVTDVEVLRVRPVLAAPPKAEGTAEGPSNEAPGVPQASPQASPPAAAPPSISPAAPPPAKVAAVAAAPAAAPAGPFQIQVGAYQTKDEAERRLAQVRERAGTVLGPHAPHMTQVKLGTKVFFRARYVGFDAQATAAGVCSELKRLEIDCLVMKAE